MVQSLSHGEGPCCFSAQEIKYTEVMPWVGPSHRELRIAVIICSSCSHHCSLIRITPMIAESFPVSLAALEACTWWLDRDGYS